MSREYERIADRIDSQTRKEQIIDAAVKLAEEQGYLNIQRNDVALRAGVSPALVSHYFALDDLKNEVVRVAVDRQIVSIIAEARSARHPRVLIISDELKQKIAEHLAR